LGQIRYKSEHKTYTTQPKVFNILMPIVKDIKETAKIQGNIDENVFLQYHEKLWNTTNINEPKLERKPGNHTENLITSDELAKALKLMKNGKCPGEDNMNSELYKYAPKEFKLRLLKFLNNIYTKNSIPNEWRNASVIPIFKRGDRRDPKNYRGISILNACYNIYSKILNSKLQRYTVYDRNIKWIPKGTFMHRFNILPQIIN
jgi:hypothetical protein